MSALKYLVFALAALAGIPLTALVAGSGRAGRLLVIALIAFSPFVAGRARLNVMSHEFYRGPDRGFEITLTDLLVAGLGLSLLARGRLFRRAPANLLPVLACGAIATASLASSAVPLYTSFTLFKLARCFALYVVLAAALETPDDRRALLAGWTAMGLCLGAMAFYQKYVAGLYRVPGPFDHSNTIPLYANLAMAPVLVSAFIEPSWPTWRRGLALASALGMTFAVVATFSRAGMLLSALSIAAVLASVQLRAPSRGAHLTVLVLTVSLLGAGLKVSGSVIRRFREAPASSEEARHEFNQAAAMMATDHTFGVGLNAFSHVMTVEDRYREHLTAMANEEHAGVAHHIYWLTAAELGWPGLALFVFTIGRFAWLALRAAVRPTGATALYATAALVGAATLHAAGFLEWALRITPVSYQYTIHAALVGALATRR